MSLFTPIKWHNVIHSRLEELSVLGLSVFKTISLLVVYTIFVVRYREITFQHQKPNKNFTFNQLFI